MMETNSMIPKDLIEGILSRLGVKDLLRFRCVCKSWRALIDDPTFIRTHYNVRYTMHKAQGNVPLFLFSIFGSCYILSKQLGHNDDDNDDDHVGLVDITADILRDTKYLNYSEYYVDYLGVANGIICIRLEYGSVNDIPQLSYGLWNPATRELKIIPKPYHPYVSVKGFGFDPIYNDFKVVAMLEIEDRNLVLYGVYSLNTNSWKKLPYLNYFLNPSQMDACYNGVYYWTTYNDEFRFHIVSLNFSTEEFKVLDPPQFPHLCMHSFSSEYPNYSHYALVPQIGLYKECLALTLTHRSVLNKKVIIKVEIWVATKFDAEDFEVPLEWQCVLAIKPFTMNYLCSCARTSPVDGQILLCNASDNYGCTKEWFLYDLKTCRSNNLKLTSHDQRFSSFRYVESLYPLLRRVTHP